MTARLVPVAVVDPVLDLSRRTGDIIAYLRAEQLVNGQVADMLQTARDLHQLVDAVEAATIVEARARGWTYQQVADALGITRQRAHQIGNRR
jgi:hypothetical protein